MSDGRATIAPHFLLSCRPMLALRAALVCMLVSVFAVPATAHPHVWVTMKNELVYAPDGSVTGIRHHWAFDDMFSAFALQGIASKVKGQYTRAELAPLAKVNIDSLKEYKYFTYATADGKTAPFVDPLPGYWLDYKDFDPGAEFHAAVQAPGQGETPQDRNLRPDHFRRF